MISANMAKNINEQINKEIYSEYLYLSMATYFDDLGLKGFANWMRVQVKEERTHALMQYTYMTEQGSKANMLAIDAPETTWESPLAAFEQVLAHEQLVTASINNLMSIAIEEKDYATIAFLQWFITEQVEEEATAKEIIDELKIVGNHGQGLLMKDRELAARIYNMPAEAANIGPI